MTPMQRQVHYTRHPPRLHDPATLATMREQYPNAQWACEPADPPSDWDVYDHRCPACLAAMETVVAAYPHAQGFIYVNGEQAGKASHPLARVHRLAQHRQEQQ